MKIAFDGEKAATDRAGVGNYGRFTIRTIAERFPDCQIDIYVPRRKDGERLEQFFRQPNVTVCYPTHPVLRHFPKLWKRFGIPYELMKRGADIYHGLGNELPANIRKAVHTRSAVTVHDLIFLFYPYSYSWLERHRLNIIYRSSCRNADRVIAVSECTSRDIVKYYFIPKSKISVAYQGCDPGFRKRCTPETLQDTRRRLSLPERYILCVGTIEMRKNAALIVKTLQDIPAIHLVLVGKRTPYAGYVESVARGCHVEDRVHILTDVGSEDLPAVYQMADVFVFPSRYEGFGIPILEALCSGVPVIGATGSCLEEAGGDAALYADPDSAGNLTQKIIKVLTDKELRREMTERGYHCASAFSEEVLADRLMEIYRDLVRR